MSDFSDYAPLLYIPADRIGLSDFLFGPKSDGLHSIAICLEDAVRPQDRREAARAIAKWLPRLAAPRAWRCHIRPADNEMLAYLLDLPGIEHIDGFVIPKTTPDRLLAWMRETAGRFALMPILETRDALDSGGRRELAAACADCREVIPRARIGANDIFALLGGLRRPRGRTIYETPVGYVIDGLIEAFSGVGLPLSGSAFDRIDDLATLDRETRDDVIRGLFSKTALNPTQVAVITAAYRPEPGEIDEARAILNPDSPAVFGLNGAMHEPACHYAWARNLLRRASAFGTLASTSHEMQSFSKQPISDDIES